MALIIVSIEGRKIDGETNWKGKTNVVTSHDKRGKNGTTLFFNFLFYLVLGF